MTRRLAFHNPLESATTQIPTPPPRSQLIVITWINLSTPKFPLASLRRSRTLLPQTLPITTWDLPSCPHTMSAPALVVVQQSPDATVSTSVSSYLDRNRPHDLPYQTSNAIRVSIPTLPTVQTPTALLTSSVSGGEVLSLLPMPTTLANGATSSKS